jgi:HNH endonuclease
LSERIPRRLRQAVERRAQGRCEYCRCPLAVATEPFAVEHIIPTVRGGATGLDNLALACSGCNGYKYDRIEGYDPVSEAQAPLYHPRRDSWREHFAWSQDHTHVVGLTPTGRVTVVMLRLNREGVVNLRRLLLLVGLHPPDETRDSMVSPLEAP